ncbi:SAV_915 family protein [Streptomyces sp. NPDC002935]|uniref:SAV_915 family protein n=1 Tax=Streptomyces sp. NPDC002935 TaxID=3154545 RepID=UPI0033A165D8
MSPLDRSEDPEPSERFPAGRHGLRLPGPLFVPVRPGPTGCTARFFRTPLGARTAVGFTSAAKLTVALGTDQTWIRLSEPALRALAAPLGVTAVTVDPQLPAPAADRAAAAAAVRERENSSRPWHPQYAGAPRVTDTAAVAAARPNLLIG